MTVNRLIIFRNGAVHATFIDGADDQPLDVLPGDFSTDGLLWYEYIEGGVKLMNRDDPRIEPLRAFVPEDTNRGWLLLKAFGGPS